MADIQLNGQALVTTTATTGPASGASEGWTTTALPAGIPALITGQTYALIDATPGATAAQQAEVIRVTACTGPGATSITVTRGADGTTPVAHAATSTFNIVAVASSFLRYVGAVNASVLTTVETIVAQIKIPANTFRVGSTISYSMFKNPAATTATTDRVRIGSAGTTADAAVVVMAATAATNTAPRYSEGLTAVTAIGASATHLGGGTETVGAITASGAATATSGTFNSTVDNFVSVTVQNTSSTTTTVFAALLQVGI